MRTTPPNHEEGGRDIAQRQENHPKRTLTSRFLAALLLSNANSSAMSSMAFFEDASGNRAKMAVSWAAGPEGRMAGSGSSGASSFATGSLWREEEEAGRSTFALPSPEWFDRQDGRMNSLDLCRAISLYRTFGTRLFSLA